MELQELIQKMQEEAEREEFPIDRVVYSSAKRNPLTPILFAGTLQSPVCFFARDLGKDEVIAGQPLYGAAGRLVRGGLHSFFYSKVADNSAEMQKAADQVLLTNTVPYKPVGNKAFTGKVKSRFRPFLESFLVDFWQGMWIIPLGTEALDWFAPYANDKAKFEVFAKTEKRFQQTFEITLQTKLQGEPRTKKAMIAPLPHPSPLNQKYYELFPQMLQERLQHIPVLKK